MEGNLADNFLHSRTDFYDYHKPKQINYGSTTKKQGSHYFTDKNPQLSSTP